LVVSNSVAIYTNRFLYDGWNLLVELQPNNTPVRSYVWGTDLSRSMQGAGGVGGLLEVSYFGTATTNCFPAFDGNGNVMALVNAGDGTLAANYEYGPFGEVIRATGPMAKVNPFRFSTKYQDDETDLLFYGYRYYKPSTGSWLSRDPLFEIAIATPLYFNSFATTEDKGKLAARWERLLSREETWLTESEFIIEGEMISENSETAVLRAAANVYNFARNNPENYLDPNGLDAIAYQDDALLGHAAIFINGNGYGFGPKDTSSTIGALWEIGTTSGWTGVPTPRTATRYEIDHDPHRPFSDGKGGKCKCDATWSRIQQCADWYAKTWDGTHYQFPSHTCRSYVAAIVSGCCLKEKSSTHEK
jgi:RHS repeat-associated protein